MLLIDGRSGADVDGWLPAEVTPAGGTKAFAPATRKAIPIVAMDRFVMWFIMTRSKMLRMIDVMTYVISRRLLGEHEWGVGRVGTA